MKRIDNNRRGTAKLISIFAGPLLSLIAFIVTYYIDPLNFGNQKPFASIPAFLFSVIILLIGHYLTTSQEVKKSNQYSDKIFEAIKDYIYVTSLGSPETAMKYIVNRLPSLREVKNTSFNLSTELERADEKFYETDIYKKSLKQIGTFSANDLIWKDIGDSYAVKRFRAIMESSKIFSKKTGKQHYKYRLINHDEPQLNFILLEYYDDQREVLFNWDFRGIGQDPTVLISKNSHLVEMFSIHFAHLWNHASIDHDNRETRSTSTK